MNKKLLGIAVCASISLAASGSVCVFADEQPQDIDTSYYLIENASDYVTLGKYTGLEAEKTVYTVTDDDVQEELADRMYNYTYTEEVTDRPAASGDSVTVDLTITVDGETQTLPDYETELGYEMLGSEFDANVINTSVGDKVTFSQTFGEDDFMTDWAGKTVDFEVTVKSIGVSVTPELTEEWVKENTDYDTLEAYSDAAAVELQEKYDQEALQQAASDLIEAGMLEAQFNGYPQEVYDELYESTVSSYQDMADMFGITLEELYESYGMDEDALSDEVQTNVQRSLFLSALALAENITLTQDDILATAEKYYADAGYETAQALLDEYGIEGLAQTCFEDKVGNFLLENAVITEVPYEESDDFDLEWSEEDETWDEEDDAYWDDSEEWDDYDEYTDGDEEEWDWSEDDTWDEEDEGWDE